MNKNLIEELKATIKIIGSLPATHDAQEIVVAAKLKLRTVVEKLEQMEREEGKPHGPDD